jgi:quercetin dioxygenase-like cupin family protein
VSADSSPSGTSPLFVQRADEASWNGPHDSWAVRAMDQVYGSGYVRTLIVPLRRSPAEQSRVFDRESPGTLHHLYVITGKVRVGPVKNVVTLVAGDFARFPGDAAHEVVCLTEQATLHVVTTVPLVPQFRTAEDW